MTCADNDVFNLLRRSDGDLGSHSHVEGQSQMSPFTEPQRLIIQTKRYLWTYNAALLLFTLCVWFWRNIKRRRKSNARSSKRHQKHDINSGTASDSSSTLSGNATPSDLKSLAGETAPLIPRFRANGERPTRWLRRVQWSLRAFMMYQPRPLPVLNKVVPQNSTSIFIMTFMAINVILAAVGIPFEKRMAVVLSDRLGLLFVVNLPLLYLLAAKNQPLKRLTGYSYESLNIFHRRLGEMMCLFALLHMAIMFYVYYDLVRPLLGLSLYRFIFNRKILSGIAALLCYETLYFTSLGSFRQRWYELFLLSHVILQAAGLGLLWFHYFTSKPYVLLAILIFVVDRVVYRLFRKSTSMTADLAIFADGETVMLSANWAIPEKQWKANSILAGWQPGAHVFVTIPSLSRSAVLQAHPFTIASAAPDLTAPNAHAWFSLLVRAYSGFSRDLLNYATRNSSVRMTIDGPYGSGEALQLLEDTDHATIVAGGSGIAVAFPLLWALLSPGNDPDPAAKPRRRVSLIWIIRSASHRSWLPAERIQELVAWGLNLHIPPPTATNGRPDVRQMIQDLVYDTPVDEKSSLVVSGPDALNREVTNTCAALVRQGRHVEVAVEKFGW